MYLKKQGDQDAHGGCGGEQGDVYGGIVHNLRLQHLKLFMVSGGKMEIKSKDVSLPKTFTPAVIYNCDNL